MNDALFRLEKVSKLYNGRRVLQIEEMQIRTGEILAVVGPSGAGKSTLLRLLNFLEPPTTGRIFFDGQLFEPGVLPAVSVRRRVTTVFQRPLLLKRSVSANVRYGLRLRGRRDARMAVDQALEQVGLAKLSRQQARSLSGGEAQRVALARAMILEPDVLLLDEPTANLDPFNVRIIETIISRLNKEKKTTIVLVTHNIFQARRLAHRVSFLLDGELVETTDKATFFGAPRDARTKAFVAGDMVY